MSINGIMVGLDLCCLRLSALEAGNGEIVAHVFPGNLDGHPDLEFAGVEIDDVRDHSDPSRTFEGNHGDDENIIALDEKSGDILWTVRNGDAYVQGRGDGARGTPTIAGDLLFALGGSGNLS